MRSMVRMLPRTLVIMASCALALSTDPAEAGFSDRDAERICRSEAYDVYDASNVHSMIINNRGGDDYVVTGIAEPYNAKRVTFVCKIKNGRLASISPPGESYSHGSNTGRDYPRIIMGQNGQGEVIFENNNCVVYYKSSGRRDYSSNSCSRNQTSDADDAMARYRREQGLGGSQHYGNAELTLYQDFNSRGRKLRLTSPAPDLRDYDFDNRASSLRVEGPWYVCTDVNYHGECTSVSGEFNLTSKWNKRISSARPGS